MGRIAKGVLHLTWTMVIRRVADITYLEMQAPVGRLGNPIVHMTNWNGTVVPLTRTVPIVFVFTSLT